MWINRMGYQLKGRSDLHLSRKVWHFTGVIFILVVYLNVSRSIAVQAITMAACLFVISDILRHQIPALNKGLMTFFHPIMREHERNQMAGTSYLLLGVFITILLFPEQIVVLSLLFLAVADPLASFVGILYGKDKIVGNKSLQGSMGAFIACSILAAGYYYTENLMTERILIVSILSGVIGAVAELFPIGKLDDNLTFPVVSSTLLWLLFLVFGGFY